MNSHVGKMAGAVIGVDLPRCFSSVVEAEEMGAAVYLDALIAFVLDHGAWFHDNVR